MSTPFVIGTPLTPEQKAARAEMLIVRLPLIELIYTGIRPEHAEAAVNLIRDAFVYAHGSVRHAETGQRYANWIDDLKAERPAWFGVPMVDAENRMTPEAVAILNRLSKEETERYERLRYGEVTP
ncbi:MAG: hypothetical protein IT434_05255 [Phycisphaerales bacterium]|jgi:hypothetical protein|nr:hypothetical protein [Phycisphaerales bacterium]